MSDSLHFIRPYLRGWLIIVGGMVLAFMAASKYLHYVTPMYESTAKFRLADVSEGVPNSNLFKDLDVFATTQKINTEIELLKSHALIAQALEKVPFEVQIFRSGSIRKTELFQDSPIRIIPLRWPEPLKDKPFVLQVDAQEAFLLTDDRGTQYRGHLGDTLLIQDALVVFLLNEDLAAAKQDMQVADDYLFSVLSLAKQIRQVSAQLDIIAVDKDLPVIRISYKSSHPQKAALFPNALAEAYIEDYIENKYSAADLTVDFLTDRIEEISRKLYQSEQMILSYRDRQHITNIRQETETDLRQISQLKIQLTNLKMSLEAIRELERYIQSGKNNFLALAPNFEAFTDLLSTEIIKNIKQLQAEKKDLLLQYTEKDEKVRVIDAKIQDLTSYLIESITNTRKNIETKYKKLAADIEVAEAAFVDVPEKERMMTILNREFEIYQQSYNFLNQKKIEAEIAKSAKMAFHRIITPATMSTDPVSPNRIIIKVVSAILGMMGAIVLIFIVHTLKARVHNVATVESNSMAPIVATVPKFKTAPEQETFFVKTLAEWEVKGILQAEGLTCFTGFGQGQGARFISAQLARVLATQKRAVLLVVLHRAAEAPLPTLWTEEKRGDYLTQALVSEAHLKGLSTQQWQDFLTAKAAGYAHTLVLNTDFGQAYTLPTMAKAHLNIVCLDTRLTPAKLIAQVDLLTEAYRLPQVFLALNRVGYNPSFLRETLKGLRKGLRCLRRKKPKNTPI